MIRMEATPSHPAPCSQPLGACPRSADRDGRRPVAAPAPERPPPGGPASGPNPRRNGAAHGLAKGAAGALQTEPLYRELLEAAPDAVFVIEANAPHYLLVNAAAEQLLGYSRDELLQMGPADILDPDELPRLSEVRRQFEAAGAWRGEWRLRRKDGSIVPVEATSTRHKIGGRVLHQGFFRDITERKRIEQALAQREAQLAEAQRLARLGSWELDLATGRVSCSDEFYRILGLDPPAVPPTLDAVLASVHPEDRPCVRSLVAGIVRTGGPIERHARVVRPNGEVRFIHGQGALVRDGAGRPARLVGIIQDVTERQQAAMAVEHERREKAALLDSTAEAIIGLDLAGRCTFVNRAGSALLGYEPTELIGRLLHPLIHHSYPDGTPYPAEACPIYGAYHSGRTVCLDGEVLWRRDGTSFPVEYSSSPIVEDGRITGAVVSVVDVTARKRAEAEREELLAREQAARAELLRAQSQLVQQERLRALGEMASGIAHDFNNALAPIMGYSELLLMRLDDWGEGTTEARQFLELINQGAQDAADVVCRLREFYRQRGPDEHFEPIALDTLVAQIVDLTQPRWKDQAQASGRQIRMETSLAPVPRIAGNAAELREVLTNLVFNAVDALPAGGTITIATRVDGDQVLLSVSDTGIGMSDEARQRCLEPFFTTKGEWGTGMGLAMVYGTVQRHGATLAVESAPGRGTTITIRFPTGSLLPAQDAAAPDAAPARALRVLVVDDDPRVREVAGAYLANDGHVVEKAADGAQALARFQETPFDLVLTDRAMPAMTGDELVQAIKAVSPTTPTIMMTGFGDVMAATGTCPPGVDRLLRKPATLAELRRAVEDVACA